jgi:TolB-like protein
LIPLPALFAHFWAAGLAGTSAAESKPIRLAIGPFLAPVGSEGLRQASQAMPDLLMTELSHQPRFHLVERDKVESIWSEMKLTSSGLVARDTVAKLGQVLACDWLVSGSFVQAGGKTNVWTKVIDIHTGVVLDLNNSPLEDGDYTKAIAGIAAFLAKAGSEPKGRQFITMGQFVDMNPPSAPKREDWSRRTAALIERHFHQAGYGVVEMAAVGPIFEERRLESAGLTGNPDGRVKLQPAFWLVDGGWGWLEGEPQKVGVALRVQQIGGPEQMIRLTNSPGELMENDVIRALTEALTRTNLLAQSNPNAEADLLNVRGQEMAERRVAFQPFRTSSSGGQRMTQWDSYKRLQEQTKHQMENYRALMANYERVLLRDPENQQAKAMLAYGLLADSDRTRKESGLEMLREVAANKKDAEWAVKAHRTLTNAPVLQQMMVHNNNPHLARPTDWGSLNQAYEENPSNQEYKCDLAAALIVRRWESDRDKGYKLLSEVATGDDTVQAERARKLLAQPAQVPSDNVPKSAAVPVVVSQPEPEEDSITKARREFLQKNFDKFIPAKFQIDGPEVALLQNLPVQKNMFEYDGRYYCGFRFIVPPQIDGSLEWMQILDKTEAEKDFVAANFKCFIVPKDGKMDGKVTHSQTSVENYKKLRGRFPYTKRFISYELPRQYLKPGEEYGIWFSFEEKNSPDIAFALAIASYSGYKRYGFLPMR